MTKSVSVLLGAGFSAPIGYPTADKLNSQLVNCTGDNFSFHTSGVLTVSIDGDKPDFGYKNSYEFEFDFCKALIKYFNESKGYFDYEEFYDFIKDGAKTDKNVEQVAKPFLNQGTKVDQIIYGLENIYVQLISYYLRDKNGEAYYDNAAHICGPTYPGYTGILNCLKKISETSFLNIHSLNHDLFLERLNYSDWLQGELCDGFEELGSPYYGKLQTDNRVYSVRLERYTGLYNKKFRLYKLHGSRDYVVFYSQQGSIASPEIYIKSRYKVGFGELFKEKLNSKGQLEYERCGLNYHADFLTGKTAKINRYGETLLYKGLFDKFKQNLEEADKLIIVGYGGKDSEVNKILLENFAFREKKSFIVDPYPNDKLKELSLRLNSTIVPKQLDALEFSDIGI